MGFWLRSDGSDDAEGGAVRSCSWGAKMQVVSTRMRWAVWYAAW